MINGIYLECIDRFFDQTLLKHALLTKSLTGGPKILAAVETELNDRASASLVEVETFCLVVVGALNAYVCVLNFGIVVQTYSNRHA